MEANELPHRICAGASWQHHSRSRRRSARALGPLADGLQPADRGLGGRFRAEDRQRHSDCGAFTQFALDFDFAAMQINAALDDDQPETGAGTVADIAAAMKGVKEPFPIGFGNPDAMVPDEANNVFTGACDFELDRFSGVGIFHGIGEDIGENVAQQALIDMHLGRQFSQQELDWASPHRGREDFVDQPGDN